MIHLSIKYLTSIILIQIFQRNSQMKSFCILIVFLFILGCGQNKSPTEIVRIQKGSSLMRQVAPTLRRGSSNVFLVGENVSDKDLNNYLNNHNRKSNGSKYQILYISGPKAKTKRNFRSNLATINKKKYKAGVKNRGSGMVIRKRKRKVGNNRNIQDNLHKK